MLKRKVAPKRATGTLYLVSLIALLALAGQDRLAAAADIDVWVDPGHGANHPGARGFNQVSPYPEEQATLEVSQHLSSALASNGYSSLKTRNSNLGTTLVNCPGFSGELLT